MNHVRIHGDPFSDTPESSQLRSFLRFGVGDGLRCALSLSGLANRDPRPGERSVELTDGVRTWQIATHLPPAEIEFVLRAEAERVHATAPVVVFGASATGPADEVGDVARLAALQWPQATTVICAKPSMTAIDLARRVHAECRWAGVENPAHALPEAELEPWLALPNAQRSNVLVHVFDDLFAAGTDLLLDAFVDRFRADGIRLRLVASGATGPQLAAVRDLLGIAEGGSTPDGVELCVARFAPEHVADAAAIVLPMRRFEQGRWLVEALASGRPVCSARFAANAQLLHGRGIVHAIGGRTVTGDAGRGAFFAPHPMAITSQVRAALADPDPAAMGSRARVHVVSELSTMRPAVPPPPLPRHPEERPSVVLEAPLFETSSSAELTIATARALHRRGNVDLKMVPTGPFVHDLAWLRQRAPELVSCLARRPVDVDLWLSAGWPVRAARPVCRQWALRVDWEYGSLPLELTPHVTEEADRIVVHSEHVYRTMTAAGRSMRSISVIPHGVDEAMQERATPDAEIVRFKAGRPAILFCGGMVWRKGFDVFLSAVLSARAQGHEFVVVVKDVGANQHYARHHLGALLERMQGTRGAPPVLRLGGDLSRTELASVYTACDVLLHPFRGEGFGMPLLEARACGLPVIATGAGPGKDLLHGSGAHLIESVRRNVELPSAHVAMPWVCEPSPDSAAELLAQVLSNLPAQHEAAVRVAPAVRAAFSWDRSAASIEELALEGFRGRSVLGAPPVPVVVLPSPASPEVAAPVPAVREPVL